MLRVNQLSGFGGQAGAAGSTYSLIAAAGSYGLTGTAAGMQKRTAQAIAFLARTTSLDATHTNACAALIDGLVADGIWSKFDAIWLFAQQDTTNAVLNLVSSSYTVTPVSSPAFVADRGYTGDADPSYLNTNYNPSTAGGQLTQNDAHISLWSVVDIGTSANLAMGIFDTNLIGIHVKWTDGEVKYYCNSGPGAATNLANAVATGHYIASRDNSSTTVAGYKNATLMDSSPETSTALINRNIYVGAGNYSGTAQGSLHQIAMASVGAGLSGAQATLFYNRLRTYMTAVGVP